MLTKNVFRSWLERSKRISILLVALCCTEVESFIEYLDKPIKRYYLLEPPSFRAEPDTCDRRN